MIEYEKVELTEEELKAAILEGKKKKYFHEKNKHHWPKEKQTQQQMTEYFQKVDLQWGHRKYEQDI